MSDALAEDELINLRFKIAKVSLFNCRHFYKSCSIFWDI